MKRITAHNVGGYKALRSRVFVHSYPVNIKANMSAPINALDIIAKRKYAVTSAMKDRAAQFASMRPSQPSVQSVVAGRKMPHLVDADEKVSEPKWVCPSEGVGIWMYKGAEYIRDNEDRVWTAFINSNGEFEHDKWCGKYNPMTNRFDKTVIDPRFNLDEDEDENASLRFLTTIYSRFNLDEDEDEKASWLFGLTIYPRFDSDKDDATVKMAEQLSLQEYVHEQSRRQVHRNEVDMVVKIAEQLSLQEYVHEQARRQVRHVVTSAQHAKKERK